MPAGRVILDGHPIVWFTDQDARAQVECKSSFDGTVSLSILNKPLDPADPTSSFWNEDDEEEEP